MTVARETAGAPLCPGEPVALRIVLHNATGGAVMIPDWEHFTEMVTVRVRLTNIPGLPGAPAEEPATPAGWQGGPFQQRDFWPLPPGDTVILRSVTPMAPGTMHVAVQVDSPSDIYRSLIDAKDYRIEKAWKGRLAATLTADVPAAESPAMKARYDLARLRLGDPLVPADQKGRILAHVAWEKHTLAARFLREQCDAPLPTSRITSPHPPQSRTALPAGPMRDAAIGYLLDLAKSGPGYEHTAFLLAALNDPNVGQLARENLLTWVAETLAARGRATVGDQAQYVWPDALLKDARDQIGRLTKDRNPYFAAKARETLLQLVAPARK